MPGFRWAWFALLPIALSRPEPLPGQETTELLAVDPAQSQLYVVTRRSGLLSFLGHDHAIMATEFSGNVCRVRAEPASTRGSVSVAAAGLVIDSDSARAVADLDHGPAAGQVRSIQKKLFDSDHLDVLRHPELRLDITGGQDVGPGQAEVQGNLTIRGISRDVRFTARSTDLAGNGTHVRGVLRIRQTDFGIRPESVAGVVRVADAVDIHFNLALVPTTEPCR